MRCSAKLAFSGTLRFLSFRVKCHKVHSHDFPEKGMKFVHENRILIVAADIVLTELGFFFLEIIFIPGKI